MMTPEEAEDYVYRSYLRVSDRYAFDTPDSQRRFPPYAAPVIRDLAPDRPAVVITGSKGKGSVAVMTEAILRVSGRTGLLTSPHLVDFCERFAVDGLQATPEYFAAHTARVAALLDPVDAALPAGRCISPMAVQTAVAMSMFADAGVERMVLECGKGARYDDVNSVPHRYGVINPVFAEHTRELGATPELIAADKAHVIADGTQVAFAARQSESVMRVIEKRAAAMKCDLRRYGRDFRCDNISVSDRGTVADIRVGDIEIPQVHIPLIGAHQAENCALAFAVAMEMCGHKIDIDAARRNLSAVRRPGRLEIVERDPVVLLDACINRASCRGVLDTLRTLGVKRCVSIIGIPDDKDYLGVAQTMAPVSQRIILTSSGNPHYRFTLTEQQSNLVSAGISAETAPALAEALAEAYDSALPIVILGTTSLISGFYSQRIYSE